MNITKILSVLSLLILVTACGGGGGGNTPAVTLDAISVSPNTSVIEEGSTQSFIATGNYSDGSSQDITTSVTWSSSDNAVATIDSTGQATGVSVGNVTITAADSALSTTADLSIIAANTPMYTVGGTVNGLAGTGLQLQLNNSKTLDVTSNGSFQFSTLLSDSVSYSVTVLSQPTNLSQNCIASNNSGTISGASVTDVQIQCTINSFNINVTISGITDSGLVLQNNASDDLVADADGDYTFSIPVLSGDSYAVSVLSNPSEQSCEPADNSEAGTVTDNDVQVSVSCLPLVARFAYVNNTLDDTISMYIVDPQTGLLRHNGYIPTGDGPRYMIMDPQQRFIYTANNNSGDISAFEINEANGSLAPVSSSPYTTLGNNPRSLAISPSGNYLYVTNFGSNTIVGYDVDTVNGGLAPLGTFASTGIQPRGIVIEPSGRFAYVANAGSNDITVFNITNTGNLAVVDADTSTAGVQQSIAAGAGPTGMLIDTSGEFLYVTNIDDGSITTYRIDSATGSLTEHSLFATGLSQPFAIALNNDGQFAYVSFSGSDSAATYSISNGVLSFENTVLTGNLPRTVHTFPYSEFVYVPNAGSDDISIFNIDNTTGVLLPAGTATARDGSRSMVMKRGRNAVSHIARNAYIVNSNSNSISVLEIDSTTGQFTEVETEAGANNDDPRLIAVEPFSRFAYVANYGADTVSQYSINQDGSLDEIFQPISLESQLSSENHPVYVLVDPSARFVYALHQDNAGTSYITTLEINQESGELTKIHFPNIVNAGFATSLSFDPSGRFIYVANGSGVSVFRVSPSTGELTQLSTAVSTGTFYAASVDPSGRYVYAVDNQGSELVSFVIDNETGTLTEIDALSTDSSSPVNVSIDPAGRFIYVIDNLNEAVDIYSIDQLTGLPASINSPALSNGTSLSVSTDPSGNYCYVVNNSTDDVTTFRIDSSQGTLTEISSEFPVGDSPQSITVIGTIQ